MTRPVLPISPPARRLTRWIAAFGLGLALSTLAVPASARAPDADARYAAARDALEADQLERAEAELEALIADEGYAPGALRALGDARLARGELGLAILAYERAALLEPGDADLRAQLATARERAGVSVPEATVIELVVRAWPARRWMLTGGVALALFVLGCLVAGAWRRVRLPASIATLASGAVVAACAGAVFIGTVGVDRVIALEDAAARVSPIAGGEPIFDVRQGARLEATDQHEGFVRLRGPDGQLGWVPRDRVEPVVPGALR